MEEDAIYDFPDVNTADADGLLAIGGNLSPGTLLNAYQKGIFPWFTPGEEIQWYSPDPRFVLFPDRLKISHSMRQVFNSHLYNFSMDKAFEEVLHNCRTTERKDQTGTWIGDEMEVAYNELFRRGYAHSAEAWQNKELVGGLYGIGLGKIFFGESMFSHKSNASKFAFIRCVELLRSTGVALIDCQIYTPHLERFGAEMIPRTEFTRLLQELIW